MRIEICQRLSLDEVVALLRDVRLRLRPDVRVYEDSLIASRVVHPGEVNPAQLYVVEEQLDLQRSLRRGLLEQAAVDPFDLAGGLGVRIDGGRPRLLLPPIIESTPRLIRYHGGPADRGTERIHIPVVHDGTHRMYLARELDLDVRVIRISRVPDEYPFYAQPVSWTRVQRVASKPALKAARRIYVRDDPDVLYREFLALDRVCHSGTIR